MNSVSRITNDKYKEIELKFKKKKGLISLRKVDNLIFISGHGPEDRITGVPIFKGRVGKDITAEEGYLAARECAIIIIAVLRDYLGNLDRIKSIVKVFGMVNCAESFNDIDYVMDGFSDTMMDIFAERGYHTRTIMGTRNLPNKNISVEIEAIVSVYQ